MLSSFLSDLGCSLSFFFFLFPMAAGKSAWSWLFYSRLHNWKMELHYTKRLFLTSRSLLSIVAKEVRCLIVDSVCPFLALRNRGDGSHREQHRRGLKPIDHLSRSRGPVCVDGAGEVCRARRSALFHRYGQRSRRDRRAVLVEEEHVRGCRWILSGRRRRGEDCQLCCIIAAAKPGGGHVQHHRIGLPIHWVWQHFLGWNSGRFASFNGEWQKKKKIGAGRH